MINRRRLLQSGLAAAAALPFSSLRSAFAAEVNLRILYWGSPDRVKRTDAVSALFAKTYPGMTANAEVASDYWPKLNTMMAGGNLPDVVQLEPNTLPDYSRRGVLTPLDDLIAKGTIRTADMVKSALDLTRVDRKVTGIAQSINSFALIYDKSAYAKAGIPEPRFGLTWDDYARQAVEITKASGKSRYWGAPYGARAHPVFHSWLTQRGKTLFTEDQKIGFDIDDAKEFYGYWENLRKAGGCTPGDVSSKSILTPDSSEMASRNSSSALMYSNQLVAYNTLLPDVKLGVAPFPIIKQGGISGMFYRPGLIWSISKDCKNIEAAAKYIDFFVNDMGAGKVLEVERGIPPNLKVRAEVLAHLGEYSRLSVEFTNSIEKIVGPYPPASPAGAIEVDTGVMRPMGDQLAFGKVTVDEAAKKLVDGAKRAIRQS
jgi:multiple sugar transport system substrate-binding protein